jgi:hypothetical protein
MTWQAMQSTDINGVELEIWDRGSGEPVVFVLPQLYRRNDSTGRNPNPVHFSPFS